MPAHSSPVSRWIGTLLGFAGLLLLGLETASSGHLHLVSGHTLHHHHFYSDAHEHSEARPGHDHDDDHEGPAPKDHAGRRTVTIPAAPVTFQPVAAGLPAPPLVVWTLLAPALVLALVVRLVIQPDRPRGPPVPGIVWQKGSPRCRP